MIRRGSLVRPPPGLELEVAGIALTSGRTRNSIDDAQSGIAPNAPGRRVKMYSCSFDEQEESMNKLVLSLLLSAVFVVPAFSQMSMSMEEHQEGYGQIRELCTIDKMIGICTEHPKLALTDEPADTEMKRKEARLSAELRIADKEIMEIMEVEDFDLEKALQ